MFLFETVILLDSGVRRNDDPFKTVILLDSGVRRNDDPFKTVILLDSGVRRNDGPYYYRLALSKNFLTLSNQLLALGR